MSMDIQRLVAEHQNLQGITNHRLGVLMGEWIDALKLLIREAQQGSPEAKAMLNEVGRSLDAIASAKSGIVLP